jgi:hypothetical protein
VALARQAMLTHGDSMKDAIYQVRPSDGGWIVQIDKAPDYPGGGHQPKLIVDATSFVTFDADGQVIRVSEHRAATRPATGALFSVASGDYIPRMPRTARKAPGGVIFHVLNRGVGRRDLFEKEEDFAAFERVVAHALEQVPIDLFALLPDVQSRSPELA